MKRLTKDEYFLAMAGMAALRATCDRARVGCVIVKDGEVISTGYNGAAPGLAECDAVGHLLVLGDDGRHHCKRTIHAEANALYQAKAKCRNLAGATAYVSATSCEVCMAEMLKWGIKRVVFGSVYKNVDNAPLRKRMLEAWSAVADYRPAPEITLVFDENVEEHKNVEIVRIPSK